jgi:hypothetical protein
MLARRVSLPRTRAMLAEARAERGHHTENQELAHDKRR